MESPGQPPDTGGPQASAEWQHQAWRLHKRPMSVGHAGWPACLPGECQLLGLHVPSSATRLKGSPAPAPVGMSQRVAPPLVLVTKTRLCFLGGGGAPPIKTDKKPVPTPGS